MKLESILKLSIPLIITSIAIYEAFLWYQDKYLPENYVGKLREKGL